MREKPLGTDAGLASGRQQEGAGRELEKTLDVAKPRKQKDRQATEPHGQSVQERQAGKESFPHPRSG